MDYAPDADFHFLFDEITKCHDDMLRAARRVVIFADAAVDRGYSPSFDERVIKTGLTLALKDFLRVYEHYEDIFDQAFEMPFELVKGLKAVSEGEFPEDILEVTSRVVKFTKNSIEYFQQLALSERELNHERAFAHYGAKWLYKAE